MATNCYAAMFGCLHFYKIAFPNLERCVGLRLEKCGRVGCCPKRVGCMVLRLEKRWSGGQEFCGFQVGKKGKKVGKKRTKFGSFCFL